MVSLRIIYLSVIIIIIFSVCWHYSEATCQVNVKICQFGKVKPQVYWIRNVKYHHFRHFSLPPGGKYSINNLEIIKNVPEQVSLYWFCGISYVEVWDSSHMMSTIQCTKKKRVVKLQYNIYSKHLFKENIFDSLFIR